MSNEDLIQALLESNTSGQDEGGKREEVPNESSSKERIEEVKCPRFVEIRAKLPVDAYLYLKTYAIAKNMRLSEAIRHLLIKQLKSIKICFV